MGYRVNSCISSGDPLRERPAHVERYTVRGRETRDDFVSLLFEYATENGITSLKRQAMLRDSFPDRSTLLPHEQRTPEFARFPLHRRGCE